MGKVALYPKVWQEFAYTNNPTVFLGPTLLLKHPAATRIPKSSRLVLVLAMVRRF
jgi:hypothetical protein